MSPRSRTRFNLAEHAADPVLAVCETDGIGFLPWAPIGMGALPGSSPALAAVAGRHGATQAQIALAWLLHRSPVLLPIPGTGSVEHLRENIAAAAIELVACCSCVWPRAAWPCAALFVATGPERDAIGLAGAAVAVAS